MKRIAWIVAALWVAANVLGFIYAAAAEIEVSGFPIGADLAVYKQGVADFTQGGAVYDLTAGAMTTNLSYRYHPAFLLPMALLVQLPHALQMVLWFGGIAAAYLGGLWLWYRLLKRMGVSFWPGVFGFALIAYDWIGNLSYGNVGPAMVLLSGLLMWAVLEKRLLMIGLIAAVIAVIKPQWCFPLLYPLVMREDRTFLRAMASALVGYLLVSGGFVLAAGFARGLAVLGDYYQFLFTLQSRYPWQGTEAAFSTFQNSIYQTFFRYSGLTTFSTGATLAVQAVLLLTFAWMIVRARAKKEAVVSLETTLAGYVVAMCMLPQLEEALLAGILAAVLWHKYIPTRLYPVYAVLQLPAILSLVTGISWLFIPLVIPANLLILLVMFVGIALPVKAAAALPEPVYQSAAGR